MAGDQSDKSSCCDPAAIVSNGRSVRLKPWPEFLRSLSSAKLIWCCHNIQPGDRQVQLLVKKKNQSKANKVIAGRE